MAGDLHELHRGCGRAREWASLRIDGELSEIERLLLRRHLSRCEGCRTFAEGAAAASALVRSTPREAPSRALIRPEPTVAGRRRRRHRLVAVAAAVIAGAGIGSAIALSDDDASPGSPRTGVDVAVIPPSPPAPPGGVTVTTPGANV